jgi:hypothetical protein
MTVVVAVACFGVPVASPASACTRLIGLDLAEPANGSTGVPTNVVPWFRATLGGLMVETGTPAPADGGVGGIVLTLLDDTGADVPVDAVIHSGGVASGAVELRPREELRPFTTYTIVGFVHGGVQRWELTTGEGPFDSPPRALDDLSMQISSTAIHNSCDENTIACIPIPERTTVQATVTNGETVEASTIFRGIDTFELVRRESARLAPFCIELRARNFAGELGPPSSTCSTDVESLDVMSAEVPSCVGGRVRWGPDYADDLAPGGCACSSAHNRDAAWPLALALLFLVTRTPRTRHRRRSR